MASSLWCFLECKNNPDLRFKKKKRKKKTNKCETQDIQHIVLSYFSNELN